MVCAVGSWPDSMMPHLLGDVPLKFSKIMRIMLPNHHHDNISLHGVAIICRRRAKEDFLTNVETRIYRSVVQYLKDEFKYTQVQIKRGKQKEKVKLYCSFQPANGQFCL